MQRQGTASRLIFTLIFTLMVQESRSETARATQGPNTCGAYDCLGGAKRTGRPTVGMHRDRDPGRLAPPKRIYLQRCTYSCTPFSLKVCRSGGQLSLRQRFFEPRIRSPAAFRWTITDDDDGLRFRVRPRDRGRGRGSNSKLRAREG